jgi:uroporphyrinogen-III synthase
MRLIVTRPEPDAILTAQALAALGHVPILSPAIEIVSLHAPDLQGERFQAVLVTSINAVRALAALPERKLLSRLPLLAVGDATALAAKRLGVQARSAGGDMADLVRLALADLNPDGGALLYLAGAHRSGDLAGELGARGFTVVTHIVYRAEARERLSRPAAEALREGAADGVLVYSQRCAAAFALAVRREALAPLAPRIACFCLSSRAAEPLRAITAGPVLVAAKPDQISLFALLEDASQSGEKLRLQ